MKNKPNIFEIATSELSQDAFITWLLKWADETNINEDFDLYKTGQSFVMSILEVAKFSEIPLIKKVDAGRQWENIDIWVDINEKYFIVIEDKKNSCEHGDQLNKYKQIVNNYYKNEREIIFIYLKTGNESLSSIKNIQEKGWFYYNRGYLLQVLRTSSSENNIIDDYKEYLAHIEKDTNSFTDYKQLKNWKPSEGLYLWLQNKIEDWTDWNYVPNANGGFLGFWYYFSACNNNSKREIYLQIENYVGNKINLYIRICGDWNKKTSYLYKIFELIKEESKKINIEVVKPNRFRPGEYSSIAIIKDAFKINLNGTLDLDHLLETMKAAENIVDNLVKKI
jgi:hypothetical protein